MIGQQQPTTANNSQQQSTTTHFYPALKYKREKDNPTEYRSLKNEREMHDVIKLVLT